jgi:alkanesulfonate monooxygenase SsuD/methylene tetrahydromethanopterin reductase-like flavin-dependent oxidoreductase (luciferase family)
MRIGYVLPMGEDARDGVPTTPAEIIELARDVEAAGFDSVWTFDHLLVHEDGAASPTGTWEGWTVLTAIAALTSRVRLGVLVSCTGFREPIITAKIAHTLQEISDGRLILGLGAGWHEPEYTAFGLPFDHKVDRFAEQIQIIGALIRDGRSDFTGTYHRTVNAPLLPATPDRPKPPILIGGRGPRMMDLVARHADMWNIAWFGLPGPKFTEARDRMTAACEAADRDPATLDVTVGVYVKAVDADGPGVPADIDSLRDAITQWRASGVAEILFWMDPPTKDALTTLTEAIGAAVSQAG